MNSRSLGHRAPLLWVLLPLMAGLVAGSLQWLPFPPGWSAAGAVLAAGLALGWRRAWAPGMVLGVFLGGGALYEIRRDRLPEWDTLPLREVRATLEIDRVFPARPGDWSVSGLGRLVATDAHLPELAGQRVYFSVGMKRDDPAPTRTSRLAVTGVLQTLPRNAPSDTFDGYLTGQGMNFKLTRARITGEVETADAYHLFCDKALRRFTAILGHGIESHPKFGGVLRAMLLGQQQELNDEQKDVFRESGTMHLFSVSGLHIAVIAGVIHGLLMLLRLPAAVRFAAGGILLWLYVDITGGTPSAVRAFLMVMFLHASHVLRLPGNPFSALVASAVCVLLVQPMQLFTASFQLSYGIVASLLLLGLPLGECWMERGALFTYLPKTSWRWYHHAIDRAWRWLLGVTAIGLSTTVVSTISGVVIFKLFTPVSLLANLVLIPVGSLVIISGFLALLCGLAGLGWLAMVLNHASVLLLMGIGEGVRFFVDLPGAFHAAQFFSEGIGYAVFAGLLGVIFFGYATNWEMKRGGFWTPFAFTLLALLAGMSLIPPA
ncbi:MAG: competence protein ComEC [Rariglobus sp.]|jgi:competence protein ComEC|nr:competence protein ComEC [Rariglobus sp.]